MLRFIPRVGTHIGQAIKEALKLAVKQQEPVGFMFNGTEVVVYPDSEVAWVEAHWEDMNQAAGREFMASHAYVQQQAKAAEETRKRQQAMNALLDKRPSLFELDSALRWLVEFIPVVDYGGLKYPAPLLALELASLAPANANVGRSDLMEFGNEDEAARWVIGQAVAALEKGHGPHPILADRAKALLKP